MRRKAIQSLVALSDPENVQVLVGAYARLTPDEKTDAVSALASTQDGALAMLKAVEDKKIEPQMLSPFSGPPASGAEERGGRFAHHQSVGHRQPVEA